jgi:hypothetical protein
MVLHGEMSGKTYTLASKLGAGGEGTVWTVVENRQIVAKIYHQGLDGRTAEKFHSMQLKRWSDPRVAFPVERLRDGSGHLVGLAMPKVRSKHPLYEFLHPNIRAEQSLPTGRVFQLRLACQLAKLVSDVHDQGYGIYDLNDENIRVSSGWRPRLAIVDVDSWTCLGRNPRTGQPCIYPCTVARDEYRAPSHAGSDLLLDAQRQDEWALAVFIWKLLKDGGHPFALRQVATTALPPSIHDAVNQGLFPFALQSSVPNGFEGVDAGIGVDAMDDEVWALFLRTFVDSHPDPAIRPSAKEWHVALSTWRRREEMLGFGTVIPRTEVACRWMRECSTSVGSWNPFKRLADLKQYVPIAVLAIILLGTGWACLVAIEFVKSSIAVSSSQGTAQPEHPQSPSALLSGSLRQVELRRMEPPFANTLRPVEKAEPSLKPDGKSNSERWHHAPAFWQSLLEEEEPQ